MTRLKYKEETIGQLVSQKLWNSSTGKWLFVKINLVTMTYRITNENDRNVAIGLGKSKHQLLLMAKKHVRDLGVEFFDEVRKKKAKVPTILSDKLIKEVANDLVNNGTN